MLDQCIEDGVRQRRSHFIRQRDRAPPDADGVTKFWQFDPDFPALAHRLNAKDAKHDAFDLDLSRDQGKELAAFRRFDRKHGQRNRNRLVRHLIYLVHALPPRSVTAQKYTSILTVLRTAPAL